ncbi:hypothetical protein IHE45_09G007800 [Dioscorea alata]|uniref:Uncharacterized protein n=1 Tax=Dioscorea alata TaxID=55571 RepID=A0ACB7VD54_DIOAL|nr:hypothetical protein IHE45_09G007800 [Dioscorea alata]
MAVRSASDGLSEFYFDHRSIDADEVFLAKKLIPLRPIQTPRRVKQPINRIHDGKSTAGYEKLRKMSQVPSPATAKMQPSWRMLAFAPGSAPARMEMREIRSRLRRRGSEPASPPAPGAWKLLQSLSCKAVELGS